MSTWNETMIVGLSVPGWWTGIRQWLMLHSHKQYCIRYKSTRCDIFKSPLPNSTPPFPPPPRNYKIYKFPLPTPHSRFYKVFRFPTRGREGFKYSHFKFLKYFQKLLLLVLYNFWWKLAVLALIFLCTSLQFVSWVVGGGGGVGYLKRGKLEIVTPGVSLPPSPVFLLVDRTIDFRSGSLWWKHWYYWAVLNYCWQLWACHYPSPSLRVVNLITALLPNKSDGEIDTRKSGSNERWLTSTQ